MLFYYSYTDIRTGNLIVPTSSTSVRCCTCRSIPQGTALLRSRLISPTRILASSSLHLDRSYQAVWTFKGIPPCTKKLQKAKNGRSPEISGRGTRMGQHTDPLELEVEPGPAENLATYEDEDPAAEDPRPLARPLATPS